MPVNGGEQSGTCPMYTHSSNPIAVISSECGEYTPKGVGEIHPVIHHLLQGKSLVYVYAGSVLTLYPSTG